MLNVITKAPVDKDFRCFGYFWVDLLKANIPQLQRGYDGIFHTGGFMTPINLLAAYSLFKNSRICRKNPKIVGNLKTCLRKYVLPYYTSDQESLKYDPGLFATMDQILLRDFRDAKKVFDKIGHNSGISKGTLANYRSVLYRFIKWMEKQDWYEDAFGIYEVDRTPPRKIKGFNLRQDRKGRRAYSKQTYRLTSEEITQLIEEQLSSFHRFMTAPEVPKRQDPPIREVTFKSYRSAVLMFLGWLHHIEEVDLEELRLELMSDRDWLDEFIAYGISDRGSSYGWAINMAAAALNIAKWSNYRRSKSSKYRDIESVESIRALLSELSIKHKKEPKRTISKDAIKEKLLTLQECIQVVHYLRKCCAPHTATGEKRHTTTIMSSWQRYLIIAILTYCPIRQREIRELELGVTLFRESDGYVIRLLPAQHKIGSRTGKEREFLLPDILTDDLDEWLNNWRPQVSTTHQRVFIKLQKNTVNTVGSPYEDSQLGSFVARAMYSATGYLFDSPKRTTPHDFRRIAITWQRQHGRREQDEALAEMMGHSVQEANDTYNYLTARDRTAKAKDWWKPGPAI
jgi:integrase